MFGTGQRRMVAVPPTAPQNGPSRGRVLVVDDDAALAEMLGIVLRREGYEPAFVSDGNRALGVFQQTRPDLVLLDLMLPGRNGLQICQDIRTQSTVPIVMLTAKGDTIDVVQGLEAGADDYVTKPFSFAVLTARLRALIRRGATPRPVALEAGDLRLDPSSRRVWRADEEVSLTSREFAVLDYLMRHRGQVVSKRDLIAGVWDDDFEGDPNIVEVYVGHLRRKLDRPYARDSIQTVRGAGYRLAADGG